VAEDKLGIAIAFYGIECFLFRAGSEAYFTMLAREASFALDGRGGIPPYEFFIRPSDGEVTPHIFIGQEPDSPAE